MKRDIILKIYNYIELALFAIIVDKLHWIISTSLKWHKPNAKSTQRYTNIIQRPIMPYIYLFKLGHYKYKYTDTHAGAPNKCIKSNAKYK